MRETLVVGAVIGGIVTLLFLLEVHPSETGKAPHVREAHR